MVLRSVRTLSIFALLFLLLAYLQFIKQSRAEEWKILVPPPPHIEKMHFGFNEVMADSLWLSLIQHIDECELIYKAAGIYTQKKCDRGWPFQTLNAITLLAPRFRMPFAAGAVSLSVLSSDVQGATIIFERAIKYFPHDWSILYRAAYHYMAEVKDKSRAAELLIAAAENGGPDWLPSLASKLYSEEGELALSLSTLISLRKGLPGDSRFFSKKHLDDRIEALKQRMEQVRLKKLQERQQETQKPMGKSKPSPKQKKSQ